MATVLTDRGTKSAAPREPSQNRSWEAGPMLVATFDETTS
jgi:hypothetical protein